MAARAIRTMTRRSSALACAAFVAVFAGACKSGLDDGFSVAITATFDTSVTDLSRVIAFRFVASGDESYEDTYDLERTVNRVERVLYRPKSLTRKLMIAMIALDTNGVVVAEGTTDQLELKPGATTQVSMTLLPPSEVDLGIGTDFGTGFDANPGDAGQILGAGINFITTPVVPTGANPVDVAVADWNGDGRPDVAVAAKNAGKVQVFFTLSDGALPSKPNLESNIAASPVALAAGDFTNDGKPDLEVLDAANGRVTLLIGDGNGALTAQTPIALATGGPDSMAAGDFDHDGALDLAIAESRGTTVWILFSDAAHTIITRTMAAPVTRIRTADVDGDGYLDVVVCEPSNGEVQIIQNQQMTMPKTFGQTASFTTLAAPGVVEVLVFDYDHDGDNDVYAFTPTATNGNVTVFTHQGTTFTPLVEYGSDTGSPDYHAMMVDLDGDNVLDMVATSGDPSGSGSQQMGVALAKSNAPPAYNKEDVYYVSEAGFGAFAVADFDDDGHPDVVAVNPTSATVAIALGSATGTFSAARVIADATHPRICDFNGDGIPDITILSVSGGLDLLNGDNKGGFVRSLFIPFSFATQTSIANLNGDMNLDVLSSGSDGSLLVALGTGHGTFMTPTNTKYGTSFIDIGTADVNRDGMVDAVLLDNSSTANANGTNVVVLPGDGKGGFTTPVTYAALSPVAFVVADVNGDQHADVVVVSSAGLLSIFLDGANGLAAPTHLASGIKSATGLVLLDANHDGKIDLAVSGETTHVLIGAADGTFTDSGAVYAEPSAGLAAGDVDGDGHDDLIVMTDHSIIVLPRAVERVGPTLEFAAGASLDELVAGNLTADSLVDVVTIGQRANLLVNSSH